MRKQVGAFLFQKLAPLYELRGAPPLLTPHFSARYLCHSGAFFQKSTVVQKFILASYGIMCIEVRCLIWLILNGMQPEPKK